jgi:hypothetical protein
VLQCAGIQKCRTKLCLETIWVYHHLIAAQRQSFFGHAILAGRPDKVDGLLVAIGETGAAMGLCGQQL